MVRGGPLKPRTPSGKLADRLQMEVNRAIAADKAQLAKVPRHITKVAKLQAQIARDILTIGTQNDKIKELCDLVDETKVKLGNALAELEEYRALFFGVQRPGNCRPFPETQLH